MKKDLTCSRPKASHGSSQVFNSGLWTSNLYRDQAPTTAVRGEGKINAKQKSFLRDTKRNML
jgi:hypothetical protein